jgi:putative endonuclease
MENRYFVYIIYSGTHDKYYRGYSTNPINRLMQHNNKESEYTSRFCPWILVYVEEAPTKSDAIRREKGLKKYAKNQIEDLIKLPKNIINQFSLE